MSVHFTLATSKLPSNSVRLTLAAEHGALAGTVHIVTHTRSIV